MKLYYMAGACSLSPHIILNELGLNFELIKVNRDKKLENGDDFLKINPLGYVPCLELDDGKILTEGSVIVQYMADKNNANNLVPKLGSDERYEFQTLMNFLATEVHKGYNPLFYPNVADDAKEVFKNKLLTRLEYLNNLLEHNEYVFGKEFTAADAYLAVILNWSPMVNINLDNYVNLKKYKSKIFSRESAQKALKSEGLI